MQVRSPPPDDLHSKLDFPLTVKASALTQLSGTVGPTETGRSGDGWLLPSLGLQLGVGA